MPPTPKHLLEWKIRTIQLATIKKLAVLLVHCCDCQINGVKIKETIGSHVENGGEVNDTFGGCYSVGSCNSQITEEVPKGMHYAQLKQFL